MFEYCGEDFWDKVDSVQRSLYLELTIRPWFRFHFNFLVSFSKTTLFSAVVSYCMFVYDSYILLTVSWFDRKHLVIKRSLDEVTNCY